MLLSETVKMKWNSKNVRRYQKQGYRYTHMGDEFDVKVRDLSPYSQALIKLKCDYCGREYFTKYHTWRKCSKEGIVQTDCCSNPDCTTQKAQEALFKKYGVNNACQLSFVIEKTKQTNLEKYGCENPFANKEIQEKIKKTNLEKYGVPYSIQNEEVRAKATKTCLEKYGVPNYGILYSATHKGELGSNWKGDARKTERIERYDPKYREFRRDVFIRDHFTCQCCGAKNYKGHHGTVILEAHHLNNFKDYIDERYDVNNGVTLCKECHKKFHSMYGKKHTVKKQYYEFLEKIKKIDKKIC